MRYWWTRVTASRTGCSAEGLWTTAEHIIIHISRSLSALVPQGKCTQCIFTALQSRRQSPACLDKVYFIF